MIKLHGYILLAIYLVIPVSLLIVIVDIFVLNHFLRDHLLPQNPSALALWSVFFVFPHITASFITLADKEYVLFYKKKLFIASLLICSFLLLLNYLLPIILQPTDYQVVYIAFFILYATLTIYHVLSQQFGVTMALMQNPSHGFAYETWRWSASISVTMLYIMVFAPFLIKGIPVNNYSVEHMLYGMSGILIVLTVIQGIWLTKKSKSQMGTAYLYGNMIMLLVVYALLMLGYDFFVIAIPRIIHDVTAFAVYSVHDQNRNQKSMHNLVYRRLSAIKLSPLLLCFVVAIVLANVLQCGSVFTDLWLGFHPAMQCAISTFYTPATAVNPFPQTMQISLQLLYFSGLLHYYIESVIWKKNAPHRQYVKFA